MNAASSQPDKVKNKSANIAGLQLADLLGHSVRQAILREERRSAEPLAPFGCAARAHRRNQVQPPPLQRQDRRLWQGAFPQM